MIDPENQQKAEALQQSMTNVTPNGTANNANYNLDNPMWKTYSVGNPGGANTYVSDGAKYWHG